MLEANNDIILITKKDIKSTENKEEIGEIIVFTFNLMKYDCLVIKKTLSVGFYHHRHHVSKTIQRWLMLINVTNVMKALISRSN